MLLMLLLMLLMLLLINVVDYVVDVVDDGVVIVSFNIKTLSDYSSCSSPLFSSPIEPHTFI